MRNQLTTHPDAAHNVTDCGQLWLPHPAQLTYIYTTTAVSSSAQSPVAHNALTCLNGVSSDGKRLALTRISSSIPAATALRPRRAGCQLSPSLSAHHSRLPSYDHLRRLWSASLLCLTSSPTYIYHCGQLAVYHVAHLVSHRCGCCQLPQVVKLSPLFSVIYTRSPPETRLNISFPPALKLTIYPMPGYTSAVHLLSASRPCQT